MVQGGGMSPNVELTINHDAIYREVRLLLLSLFPLEGEQVIRGYSNNVPLPKPPFILLNIINERPVATNSHSYNVDDASAEVLQSLELQMQLDFYGENAGVWQKYLPHYGVMSIPVQTLIAASHYIVMKPVIYLLPMKPTSTKRDG